MSGTPSIAIIVAVSDNGVIGKDNALPWRLSVDLRYFKKQTLGKPVIMGRKTWQSIGKALPGRQNIVVSRNAEFVAPGAFVAGGFDEAIALAGGVPEVMVIGGEAIYAEALERADRVYLTQVHVDVDGGDARFPALDPQHWQLHCDTHCPGEGGQPACTFTVWQRV